MQKFGDILFPRMTNYFFSCSHSVDYVVLQEGFNYLYETFDYIYHIVDEYLSS